MINQIRSAFKSSLDRLGWMDELTRQAAKDKVSRQTDTQLVGRQTDRQTGVLGLTSLSRQADAIYDMIGFPEFILDPKELDDVYDGVSRGLDHGPALLLPAVDELPLLFVFQYEVSDDSFFQNMLNFYNFSSRVMADQLRKTPNKDQ